MSQFPIKMQMKKTGQGVDVYAFVPENGKLKAVIFDYALYHNQGQGMHMIDAKNLIPYNVDAKKRFNTSTIKSRLKMIHAEWQCSDGKVYTRQDDAIDHERFIVAVELDLPEEEVERYLKNPAKYSEEKANDAESEP